MKRVDALKEAALVVAEMEKAPVKPNGYTVDGWRPVTFEDRISATLRIAAFLTEEGDD